MKNLIFLFSLSFIFFFIISCSNSPTDPAEEANQLEKAGKIYIAHLSGDEEVAPVITDATGQAFFMLSPDGNSLSYRLIVANITDVVQSHIHIAPAGTNGPVVAFLFGPTGGVTVNGVLAEGTITAANLIGPLAGQPLSALLEQLDNGGAYVNVHTTNHPGGEIRGQLQKNHL